MNHAHFGVYGLSVKIKSQTILSDISFELDRGQILSVIGPNGVGKSTLLKWISGVLAGEGGARAEGQLWVQGREISGLRAPQRARLITYVSADWNLEFPVSVLDVVACGRKSLDIGASDDPEMTRVLERCLCLALIERDFRTLSGGERQRVLFARALAQEPKIMLLDEAFSRLDPNHLKHFAGLVRELARDGMTLISVAHDLRLSREIADQALLLKDSKVFKIGTVAETMATSQLQALYPGL